MEKFLEKYYKEDEKIIVGCSTGPDSMYLVYKILETKFAKNLVACYFNHNLRKESIEEEKFLEDLGKQKGFTVEIASAKMREIHEKFYKSISLEELCRQKRYEFFNAILNIYKTDKIILAHHLDDKIETFFFNLARGTKISGLINMQEKSGNILRPLLKIEKKDILDYLEKNNLEYKIDKTNFENDFTRNKIRNTIIPNFYEINQKYKTNILNFMDYLEDLKENIDEEVLKFLGKYDTSPLSPLLEERENSDKKALFLQEKDLGGSLQKYFLIDDFNSLSKFLQKEVIRYIFYISNGNSTIGLNKANIEEVIKFINGKNNKTKKEIKNMKLEKDNKKIIYNLYEKNQKIQ